MSIDFSHHAYGIFGGNLQERIAHILEDFAKSRGIAITAFSLSNPDFINQKFENFTIDNSRALREIHESMPFSANVPRVFVIELHGVTREAQNALLKILEEPRPNNYFFIAAPLADIFLSTVRSRLYVVSAEVFLKTDAAKTELQVQIQTFLKLPLGEKIAFVDDLASRISDEKAVKYDAVGFLNKLERFLYDETSKTKSLTVSHKKFEAIARARNYMADQAPSVKMLLEYIALSL